MISSEEDTLLKATANQVSITLSKNYALQNLKPKLPFAILNIDGGQVAQHLTVSSYHFREISTNIGSKATFAVVTENGSVIVYDTMFRRELWKRQGSEEQVNWGEMFSDDESKDPAIVFHSRKCGLLLVTPGNKESRSGEVVIISSPIHSGFCKPIACPDQDIIVPLGLDRVGVLKWNKDKCEPIFPIAKFESTLMTVKLLKLETHTSTKYICCATEDGTIQILKISPAPPSEKGDKYYFSCNVVSKFQLPKDKKENSPAIGTCFEGDANILVVGTTVKILYLFKISHEIPYSLQPYGKKSLPTEGVSCMAMNPNANVLAVGGYDAVIRIFKFPDMTQITSFSYNTGHLNSLIFLDDYSDEEIKSFLVCANSSPALTVWRLPSDL